MPKGGLLGGLDCSSPKMRKGGPVLYNSLTQMRAKNLGTGKYADGQGLWLIKRSKIAGKWSLRLVIQAKRREMGLGRWPDVSIAEARERAAEARKRLRDGLDPIAERAKKREAPKVVTLAEAANGCFEAKKAELKNANARNRWLGLLEQHVLPKIGKLPIENIDQHLIKKTLDPIWHTKAETARKSLGHIGQTLKYAAALGLDVDMQATMKARALLGKQRHKTTHIPAMPYPDAPKFYEWLGGIDHTAALALRFLILTAARTSEVRLAKLDEIDADVWTLSPERTKTGREHRVPLTDARLCEDLFGVGKHKTVFRIFDHWGNFERFETGYQAAEPQKSKSLLQLLFEERLSLAETALQKSEVDTFDTVIKLIEADVADLPEDSVSVREKWKERRSVLDSGRLQQFSPATVVMLQTTIAPLMQWRTIRGFGEAHAFDLLIAKMQKAILIGAASLDDLKIEFLERLDRLQMHLNPVRERADTIKRAKSAEFWSDVTVNELEAIRLPLREIIHYREKQTGGGIPPKIIDVSEDDSGVLSARRSTSLKSVDMKAYKQLVEAELKKHFETNPVLKKIRSGDPVSTEDLQALVSLVLTQNPNVTREDLEEFFESTALPLDITIRSIVGLDAEAVKGKFASFVLSHPSFSAKQTRFLGLLQNHIIKFGFITIDRLYDQPFTVVDADGPEGIFEDSKDVDDLMKIVNLFAPPQGENIANVNDGTIN